MANVYDEEGNVVGEEYPPVYADPDDKPAVSPVYEDEIPSFLQRILDREKGYWAQAQQGVRQLPGYEQITDLVTGAESPRAGGVAQLLNAIKAPGNILMGTLGLIDPVGTVGAEAASTAHKAVGSPGGEWGDIAAELIGGMAGGVGTAKLASKLPFVKPAVRPGLSLTPETQPVLGRKIEFIPAKTVVDESPIQPSILTGKQAPDLPRETTTVFDEVVSSGVRQERAQLKAFLSRKNLSEDERAWAKSQLSALESKVQITPREVELFPEKSGSLITGDIPGEPSIFQRGVEVPEHIQRGPVEVVDEILTGRMKPTPGQLDQKGYQTELSDEILGKRVTPAPSKANAPDPKLAQKITDWYMMNVQNPLVKSTGLLVTAPGTAIRNFMYQGYRSTLEIPIQALQEIMYTGSLEGAWSRASTQLSGVLDYAQTRKELFDVMNRAPKEVREMLGRRGMIADYTQIKTADWYDRLIDPIQRRMNILNEKQEKLYWYSNLASSINAQLAPWGMKLGKNIRAGDLHQDIVNKAINHAFEMTYSSPMGDKVQRAYQAILEMPIAGLILNEFAPFARFNYGNALKEIIEMSPAGMVKAGMNAFDPRTQEEAARYIAKSMIGTKMIEQFARLKEDPSLDVWEINVPSLGKVDMRRWYPLSAYALIGELFNRPIGTKNSRVSGEDISAALTGGTRIDDTALAVLTHMKELSLEGTVRGLGESATSMMARWTTPFKGMQDAYALVTGDPNVMASRDVTTGKFGPFDKAVANIPGLRQMLPERIDPTLEPGDRPGPRNRGEYLAQLEGLDTVRSNEVKEELNRLKFTGPQGQATLDRIYDRLREKGIDIKTPVELPGSPTAGDYTRKMYAAEGDKDLNRAMNKLMQEVGQPFLKRFMTSEKYRNAPLEVRRFIVSTWQTELKSAFKKVAMAGGGPELAMEQFIKNMSPVTRGFLDYMTVKE